MAENSLYSFINQMEMRSGAGFRSFEAFMHTEYNQFGQSPDLAREIYPKLGKMLEEGKLHGNTAVLTPEGKMTEP